MPDFINPTGRKPRGSDCHGSGHFGAKRGSRKHKGVDYCADVDQDVKAIMDGFVTKVGYPYGDDLSYRYVEITNHETNSRIRQFYVEPKCKNGDKVSQGDVIGSVQCLDRRYKGITEHVHVEIYKNGDLANPSDYIKDE